MDLKTLCFKKEPGRGEDKEEDAAAAAAAAAAADDDGWESFL
jgi:hypothetical protein